MKHAHMSLLRASSKQVVMFAVLLLTVAACGTTSTTGVPDTTTSTTGVPDATTSTTGVPDATTSTTGVPDATTSTTGVPDATTSTTGVPDATTSTTGVPDTTTSTTGVPDTTTSTTGVPDTTTSTTGVPDTTTSTTGVPDTTTSTTGVPDTTTSTTGVPDTTTSTTGVPDTTTSTTGVPDTTTSTTGVPDTTTSTTGVPDTTTSTTGVPDATTSAGPAAAADSDYGQQLAESVATRHAMQSGITIPISPPEPFPIPIPIPIPIPPTGEFSMVFYQGYGVNPLISTTEQVYSTFGLDADTASWFRQFAYLDRGYRPNPDAIRAEEIINAFESMCDTSSATGENVNICAQATTHPFRADSNFRLMRIVVETSPVEPALSSYIVVLDKSGSMGTGDRWRVAKRTVQSLLDNLEPDDRFGMVSFNQNARVSIEPTDRDSARAIYTDTTLSPGGSTNAAEGLRMGYRLAEAEALSDPERPVTVVFLSDGVANVGPATGPGSILELVEIFRQEHDIALAAGGVGEANYNDVLLEQIADRAQGWYQYLYDRTSTERFVDKILTGIVGWEAKTQVEFDPDTVSKWRLIGYENRHIDAELFREDEQTEHKSAPLVGGAPVAAFYEIELHSETAGEQVAQATVRWRPCTGCEFSETTTTITTGATNTVFADAACDYRLQAHAARYAEFARGSVYAWGTSHPRDLLNIIKTDIDLDASTECSQSLNVLLDTVKRFLEASPIEEYRTYEPGTEPTS